MHIAKLEPDAFAGLSDRQLLRTEAFVGGEWLAALDDATFPVHNPYDGSLIARVSSLGAADSRHAVDAAAAAFEQWKTILPQGRSLLLRRWFELIVAAREDLALIMTLEQGKPLDESRGEIDYAASFVEWYAEEAKRLGAEAVVSHLEATQTFVTRQPLGVAALFTPWNFPSAMLTRKAAAAMAAGCTVAAHVASHTPLSALALAELAQRAGLPSGVFNVLTGDASVIGEVLTSDPRVRVVSFTGSTEIGRLIMAQCAPTLKRLVMELGGLAPLIIFDDADIERAVAVAMDAKFATSGQDCLAANCIYVQRALYERFCEAFARRVKELTLGDGLKPGTDIGPLMHEAAVEKAARHVDDALARGARLLAGGSPTGDGLFVAPTVLADVADSAMIMREETFTPIAAVTPFETEAEVLRRANDTEYGLVAYVVTKDGARALRMARALDFGMIAINRVKITGAPIPFGGVKQSGVGREGSRHGIEAFTDLKYICQDLA